MVPLVDLLQLVGAQPPSVSPAAAADMPAAGKMNEMPSAAGVVDYDTATEFVAVVSANDAQQTVRVVCVDPLARNAGGLFLTTGAFDDTHYANYCVFAAASCTQTDRLYEAKRQILEGMGMSAEVQSFPVFADRMPMQLLAYMRLARVQDPGELMSVCFDEDRIVSPMNEYELLQLLMQDARPSLKY
mgnify:CR=1 FL=1|jgi:protein-histidine N-methyltransferase